MRCLFLFLQLFFIFSVTELFAGTPTFTSSTVDDILNRLTLNNDGIYNVPQVSNDSGRIFNNGDALAPVQQKNTDYDKFFQSAENFLKNGGELDSKLFSDENLDSKIMSSSDEDNLALMKRLLRDYQNLTNGPELQRNATENSPDFYLQKLKKFREDFQITGFNLYRFLKKNDSPLRNDVKKEIDKFYGIINTLLDALNLMIRHLEYPNLYFKSKEDMPLGDIWGTSIGGNGAAISVTTRPSTSAAPGNGDTQNTGSAGNEGAVAAPDPNNNVQSSGSSENSNSNNNEVQNDNDAQNSENENNEENDESEQDNDSDADANDNNAGNRPPATNAEVQADDNDIEDDAAEDIKFSNDRIKDDDDDDWIGTGGIIGGVVGVGGLGALMLNSDQIEPQYDDDFYGQPTKKQTINRVTQDAVISNDDVITSSDNLDEDEIQDLSTVDNQAVAQKAEEQDMQEKNNQEDGEENDSEDSSSDEKVTAAKKDTAADDSDTKSIADSGYDSDSDADEYEDEEISEQSKTSARTNQTFQSDQTDQQPSQTQPSGRESVQRNPASVSRQNFEEDNEFEIYEKNTEIPIKNSSRSYVSDNSVEDYVHGSDNSIEDYIRGETDSYWNKNDQYSASSGSFYDGYQLVPTKTEDYRLRRFEPLDDDKLIHAGHF